MKKLMVIWLGIVLSLLIVACSGVYSPTLEPEAAAVPALVQVENSTESLNEEPVIEDDQILALAPDFTRPAGNGNMVNLGTTYWRNPDGDGNMVNLGAIIWRTMNQQ